eukprot:scaffold99557_cov33-Tisochrysis_lutea.AAC.5
MWPRGILDALHSLPHLSISLSPVSHAFSLSQVASGNAGSGGYGRVGRGDGVGWLTRERMERSRRSKMGNEG